MGFNSGFKGLRIHIEESQNLKINMAHASQVGEFKLV